MFYIACVCLLLSSAVAAGRGGLRRHDRLQRGRKHAQRRARRVLAGRHYCYYIICNVLVWWCGVLRDPGNTEEGFIVYIVSIYYLIFPSIM